jgi:hypothetical protein
MLLEDVLEILPLLMPKIFINQFVFVWGCEQCTSTTGQLARSIYYYLKDLDRVHKVAKVYLMGTWIKHCSLMMSLARYFKIQNGTNFSLSHLEDVDYPKTKCNDLTLHLS